MLLMPRLGLFAFLCWIVIIFVAAGFPAWLLGQPGFSSPCGRFSSPGKWVGASPPGQPPAIGNMKTPSCLATDISSMFHLRWRSSWFLWTWSVRVVSRGGPQVLGSSWKVVSIVPIQAIRKSDTSTCARGENVGICWRHLDLHLILRPVSRKDFYHNVCIGCQRKADAHGNFYRTQLSHTFALISQKRAAVEVAKEHSDPCHCRTDICHTFECLLHWSITGSPPNPLYKMFKTHFTSARCTCSWNCRFGCFRCFLRRFRRCSDDCTLGRCLNVWCLNSTKIKRWSIDSTL